MFCIRQVLSVDLQPITRTEAVQPICLPTAELDDLRTGDRSVSIGWGDTEGKFAKLFSQLTVVCIKLL